MASSLSSKSHWASVKTTLPAHPLPPNSTRAPVTTNRLIIRTFTPNDLHDLHALRTQPEIMANNPQGGIDRDLDETRPRMDAFLPPNDETTFNFAICDRETGDMIGTGGCYGLSSVFGWPVIGYMIRREFWGQGLATEFFQAWLSMWYRLPRQEIELDVDPRSLPAADGPVSEQITSWTTADNIASQRVLEKSGFEHFLTWTEPDLRNPDVNVELKGYRYLLLNQTLGEVR
ncbi:hypothetical protein MFIFM68171_05652 [Madurella fahalii]|uniref:N-acetyltransferase domain-containing protein n=1 Tax=Madurella fahalii TaxID=1157608 RepID=A0ABQ0GCF1_9PEZI